MLSEQLRACEVGEDPVQFFRRANPPFSVELKYDGNRALVEAGPAIFDAEHIADDGKEGSLYHLNSTRTNVIRSYRVFDLLSLGGKDLRGLPFKLRHSILVDRCMSLLPEIPACMAETIAIIHKFDEAMVAKKLAIDRGFEGIVIKPWESPYTDNAWLKVKKIHTADLAILGIKRTNSYERNGIAETLLIGHWDTKGNCWRADGLVSSGLSKDEKRDLAIRAMDCFTLRTKDAVHVKPDRFPVVEIQYKCHMPNGLREPRIRRLRTDKLPQQCDKAPT